MPELRNKKHERFCHEYVSSAVQGVRGNGTKAAIEAGYSRKTAGQQAFDLLKKPEISARVSELREGVLKALDLSAVDVARRYALIAMADPNELSSVVRGACRHCHGAGHLYQWRLPAEFQKAVQEHMLLPDSKRAMFEMPSDDGGYGYSSKADPHPECPMCEGDGMPRTVIHDTTKLSDAGRALFAGVKETQHGIEIKTQDQGAALNALARKLGLFKDDDADKAVSDLALAVAEISKRGTSIAPIAKPPAKQEPEA
ncbi:terminase small subunit [Salipiger sp.]|uniref:terminase small subunit n=1 Tax=Salipiger sp. TaxID=2078585 RepID=UPI003A9758D3